MKLAVVVALLSASAFAQVYGFAGGTLNGGLGYQVIAPEAAVVFDRTWTRLNFQAEGKWDGAKKTNDGTGQNSGWTVRGRAEFFARILPAGIFLGGGAHYSDLHTDLYSKHSWHPRAGVLRQWPYARLQADYIFPGSDRENGVEGPSFTFWIPPPGKHRWYYRETFTALSFHNLGQRQRHWGSGLETDIGYRF